MSAMPVAFGWCYDRSIQGVAVPLISACLYSFDPFRKVRPVNSTRTLFVVPLRLVILLAILATPACSSAQEAASAVWSGEEKTVGDTTIVRTSAAAPGTRRSW